MASIVAKFLDFSFFAKRKQRNWERRRKENSNCCWAQRILVSCISVSSVVNWKNSRSLKLVFYSFFANVQVCNAGWEFLCVLPELFNSLCCVRVHKHRHWCSTTNRYNRCKKYITTAATSKKANPTRKVNVIWKASLSCEFIILMLWLWTRISWKNCWGYLSEGGYWSLNTAVVVVRIMLSTGVVLVVWKMLLDIIQTADWNQNCCTCYEQLGD